MPTWLNDWGGDKPRSKCVGCGSFAYTAQEMADHVCPDDRVFKPAAEVEREYGLRPGSLTSYQQPNLWTCYPKAVSIATGIAMEILFTVIGHDGSRKLDLPGDWKEEAFVQSEMSIALFKLGYALVSFCADHANLDEPPTRRTGYPTVDELLHLTTGRPTVFVIQKPGLEHAIAKTVDGVIIDPSTGKEYADEYPLKTIEILIPIRR
jgi:hypothetical protein